MVPAAATPDTSEPWDLVWFSDSSGFFVADLWAETIAEELGVEIRVHDHAPGNLSAVEVLESLGEPTESYQRISDTRADVAAAEIIVVYGNPGGSRIASDLGDACVTTDTASRDPPTRYSAEDFGPYRAALESVCERVFALVGERPVIVRAIDLYNPVDKSLAEAPSGMPNVRPSPIVIPCPLARPTFVMSPWSSSVSYLSYRSPDLRQPSPVPC